MEHTLAVIGAGNMGEAIVAGMLRAGTISAAQVVCADPSDARLQLMHDRHGVRAASVTDAIAASDIVLLAVKPQNINDVLAQIGGAFRDGQTVVTIVAGIPIDRYSRAIPASVSIVRAMPNTPAQLGVGVTAIALGPGGSPAALEHATEIFSSVGTVVAIDESQLDAVTAVSGSGPAYVFFFTEALIDAGITAGLDTATAHKLAIGTVHGSGVMLRDAGYLPNELREMVSSPGGTTVAALTSLTEQRFATIVTDAVLAAKRRAAELAAEPG